MNDSSNKTALPLSELLVIGYCIMELTTIIFNVWTLFIFYRYPRLRIPINYILINLTINNLLYGFLILPFKIVSVLTQTWPFHPRICLLSGFINVVGFLVAVFSILAISVYRYLAIVRSQKRAISKRRVLFSIGFIWFGSAISAMLPLVGVGSYVYIPSAYMCMPDPYYNLFITLFFSTTSFILPVIFSGVLNWRLLVTVNKHSKRMQVTHQSCSFVRKDKGLTKAILSIYVGFFICFMPIGIVAYILLPLYVPVPRSVIIISSFMITIHSTTFPLICGLMHEKFKICYKQCLSDLVGGKLYRRRSGSLKSKSSFIRRTSTIRDFRCPDIQVHQASENHRSNYFIRSPMSMDNITSLLSKKRRHSTNIWRHKTFPVVQSPLPLDRAKKYSIPNTELELEDLTPSTVS